MVTVGITIFYALVSFFEILSLKKLKKKKEIVVFCIIIFLAFTVSVLLSLGVKIPSFNRWIGDIITSITGE